MKLRQLDALFGSTILTTMLQGSKSKFSTDNNVVTMAPVARISRNISPSVASVVEEVEYMHAVTNRDKHLQNTRRSPRKPFKLNSVEGGTVVFLASLFFMFWLVQQMEGINGDTVFLSVYASIVLAFSIESILFGILH